MTDLTVNLFLPPGLKPDEPIYMAPKGWPGDAAPKSGVASNGLAYYSWRSTQGNSFTRYIFGAAFPARLIPAAAILKMPNDFPGSSL